MITSTNFVTQAALGQLNNPNLNKSNYTKRGGIISYVLAYFKK